MVENRPFVTFLSHAVMILGVLVIAFPVYVTFVASTHTLERILEVPMPLLPGDQLVENYRQALTAGSTTSARPTWPIGRGSWRRRPAGAWTRTIPPAAFPDRAGRSG